MSTDQLEEASRVANLGQRDSLVPFDATLDKYGSCFASMQVGPWSSCTVGGRRNSSSSLLVVRDMEQVSSRRSHPPPCIVVLGLNARRVEKLRERTDFGKPMTLYRKYIIVRIDTYSNCTKL